MCSRECFSEKTGSWIAGVLVLLATFLVGEAIVRTTEWVDHMMLAQMERSVGVPQIFEGCHNEDGLLISRWDETVDETGPRHFVGIHNDGFEQINLDIGWRVDTWAPGAGRYEYLRETGSFDPMILPSQKGFRFISASLDSTAAMTFGYRTGSESSWHRVTYYFAAGDKFPNACSSYLYSFESE